MSKHTSYQNYLILVFFLLLLFAPILSAQVHEDNVTVFKIATKYVREGRGEALLHADVLSLEIQNAGYYRIIPKCNFDSGDEQKNESFYLTVLNSDGIVSTPVDSNAGPYKVVDDKPGPANISWRDGGSFYFSEGNNTIKMHHYVVISNQYPQFINGPFDGESVEIVDSLKLIAEPNFSNLTDVLKNDSFLDKNSDGSVSPGDIISYTITIKNSGTGIAHDVVFTDSIPSNTTYVQGSASTTRGNIATTSPSLQVDIGNILPNETEIVTISFQAVINSAGLIANQGYVSSYETDPHPTDDPDTDEEDDETIKHSPCFTGKNDVLKQDRFDDVDLSSTISAGDLITYTISIENSGSIPATNVVFTDSIPPNTSFVAGSASTSKGTIFSTAPIFQVNIGSIAAKKSEKVIITFQVKATTTADSISNQGYVNSDETNPHPTDDPDTIEKDDDTKTKLPHFNGKTDVLKTDSFHDVDCSGTISAGDLISYTITIKNSGMNTATNVVFTDSIPPNTTYVLGSLTTTKGTVVSTTPRVQVEIDIISPEEQETVTIKFQVLVTASAEQIRNQGYLDSDKTQPEPTDDPDTIDENDETVTRAPSFFGENDVLKQDQFFDTDNDSHISPGDSIAYTISIMNSGKGYAHNVVFTDSIPENTTLINGSISSTKGNIITTSPILQVNIGDVAPHEIEIITITFTVLIAESVDYIENQGWINSDETNPHPTDDPDTDKTNDKTITKLPNFQGKGDVIKSDEFQDIDSSSSLTPGDIISYTISITNSGAGIAYNVVFTDSIPEHTSYIEGSANTTKGTIVNTSPMLQVNIGAIEANKLDTVKIKFQVLVTDSVDQIGNQGRIDADETSPEPTDDPDTIDENDETITAPPNFNRPTDVLKRKEFQDLDGDSQLSPGDVIIYSISMQNSGAGVAHNVVFTDSIPQNTKYIDGSASTSKGTIENTTPVLRVNIGTIAPNKSETVTISFKVEITKSVEQISNQGVVDSDETQQEPTDDPETPKEDNETIVENKNLRADIYLYQYVLTDSFSITNNDTIKYADEEETYSIFLNVKNLGPASAKNVKIKGILPDSVTAFHFQPIASSVDKDSITWKFDSISSDSTIVLKFDVNVPPIMPIGLNHLIHRSMVSADNEDPSQLNNNTSIDTVFNSVPVPPVLQPKIEANPSEIDVTDSTKVRVQIPKNTMSWELWIYLPDGTIDKTFADDFIKNTTITPDLWYDIDEMYKPGHLITTKKEEELIFEIRTIDFLNREANSQSKVTVRSSNYLVLDRNVFKPGIENALGIKFKLSYRRTAQLDVYDLNGRHITKITEDIYEGGWNTYPWNGLTENGQQVGSGVYLVTLRAGKFNSWKKFIIIR